MMIWPRLLKSIVLGIEVDSVATEDPSVGRFDLSWMLKPISGNHLHLIGDEQRRAKSSQ